MQAAWVIRYLSGLYVTGIRGCVHIISGVTAYACGDMLCTTQRSAQRRTGLPGAHEGRVYGVRRCEALTPHTVPDSLTYDVVRKEQDRKLSQPAVLYRLRSSSSPRSLFTRWLCCTRCGGQYPPAPALTSVGHPTLPHVLNAAIPTCHLMRDVT